MKEVTVDTCNIGLKKPFQESCGKPRKKRGDSERSGKLKFLTLSRVSWELQSQQLHCYEVSYYTSDQSNSQIESSSFPLRTDGNLHQLLLVDIGDEPDQLPACGEVVPCKFASSGYVRYKKAPILFRAVADE